MKWRKGRGVLGLSSRIGEVIIINISKAKLRFIRVINL